MLSCLKYLLKKIAFKVVLNNFICITLIIVNEYK